MPSCNNCLVPNLNSCRCESLFTKVIFRSVKKIIIIREKYFEPVLADFSILGCNCTKYLPAIRWNLLWIWIVQNKLNFWGWSYETRGISQNKTSSIYRELVIFFKGMLFDWIYLILRWLLKDRILHNSYFACISNFKKLITYRKTKKKNYFLA